MDEQIRTLQKNGEFRFPGLSRSESKQAAEELARAAMRYDRKHGIRCRYGIAQDAFGYYFAVTLQD